MDYFENRNFNIGLILVFLAAGILFLFDANRILNIVAALVATIGLVMMFRGVKRSNGNHKV
ncbi:MAG: hypothetical protein AAGG68_11570 [Bacteroidota bacterium]